MMGQLTNVLKEMKPGHQDDKGAKMKNEAKRRRRGVYVRERGTDVETDRDRGQGRGAGGDRQTVKNVSK